MNSQPEIDVAGVQPAQDEQKDLSFAEMLKQLEAIVDRLESGELSLEESLAKFEEGGTAGETTGIHLGPCREQGSGNTQGGSGTP